MNAKTAEQRFLDWFVELGHYETPIAILDAECAIRKLSSGERDIVVNCTREQGVFVAISVLKLTPKGLLRLACDFAEHGLPCHADERTITALGAVAGWVDGKVTDDELKKATADSWKTSAKCRASWTAGVLKAYAEYENYEPSYEYYDIVLNPLKQLFFSAASEAVGCAVLNGRNLLYAHNSEWVKRMNDEESKKKELQWQIDRLIEAMQ